jgi:hypothetical protein
MAALTLNDQPPQLRLSPCYSRRGLLLRAIGGVAVLIAAPRNGEAQTQMSQQTAGYQDHPDGNKECQLCAQFTPPGACRIVAGPISSHGSCRFFAKKLPA